MSKPWVLQDLMTAVDAGHVIDSDKLLVPRRSTTVGSRGHGRNKGAPVPVKVPAPAPASSDTSFEFSAAVSYSSASPASMVFSDGQLRAHQFPAVLSPPPAAGTGRSSSSSSKAKAAPAPASPVRLRSASTGSSAAGSKKRVSFAVDGADIRAAAGGGGQAKKSGGLLGCMGSACGSSRSDVVEPARNANRKVVAV